MAAFTQRQTTPKKDQPYRGVVRKFDSSDDDDSSDQSDSDEEQSWKRRKTFRAPPVSHRVPQSESGRGRPIVRPRTQGSDDATSSRGDGTSGSGAKRRRNNVWGSIVAEQNQEVVERELNQFGVEADVMDRDVESYYKPSQQPQLGLFTAVPAEPSAQQGRNIVKEVGEEEDDAWLAEGSPPHSDDEDAADKTAQPDLRERLKQRGSMIADQFRQSNVKSRLGNLPDVDEPPLTIMRSVDIDPEGEDKVVAGQLAYSLQEPKRHLMLRVVKILGVAKSLEIWRKTEEIENDGGMMIRNRSRRRAPGGVFIQLMKTDPDVSKEDIKAIFAEEKAAFDAEKKSRRRHKRKQAGGSMDVDRHGDKDVAEEGMDDDAEVDGEQNNSFQLGDGDAVAGERKAVGEEEKLACMDQADSEQRDADFPEQEADAGPGADHGVPLPEQESADLREHNDNLLSFMQDIKPEDIPKRNEDSEPEDGEVIDDEEDGC